MRLNFNLNRLSIRLAVLIGLFVVVGGGVVGGVAVAVARNAFINTAILNMEVLRNERARAVLDGLDGKKKLLDTFTYQPGIVDAFKAFRTAFTALSPEGRAALVRTYVDDNRYPFDTRSALIDGGDRSAYTEVHKTYHSTFLRWAQLNDLAGIMLVDLDGNVIYTVNKQADFGANLLTGPLQNEISGKLFRRALAQVPPWETVFSDLERYTPSQNQPSLLLATALQDAAGKVIGVAIMELKTEMLTEVANNVKDLGETGEVYLVGADLTNRSKTRFLSDGLLERKIDTLSARRAIKGFSSAELALDYHGHEVIGAYGPIDFLGVRWGLVSKIDTGEVLAPVNHMIALIVGSGILSVLALGLLGAWAARSVSRPLEKSIAAMGKLSAGQLHFELETAGGTVETRKIADALKIFQKNLIETEQLVGEVKAGQAQMADLLDSSPTGILVITAEEEVLFANDTGALILGRRKNQMVGAKFSFGDLAPAPQEWARLLTDVHRTGFVPDAELAILTQEKGALTLEVSLRKTKFGGRDAILVWFVDVTEQRKASAELRELSSRFIAFLESAPDMVVIKDTDGRIQAASQSFAAFATHKSWRDLLGRTSSELFPGDFGRAREAADLAVMHGTANLVESEEKFTLRNSDIWLSTKRILLRAFDGAVTGVLVISRDVTEKKHADEALAAALALAKTERTKSQTILDASPDPIVIVRKDRTIEYVNRRFAEILGYDSADILGKEVETIIPQRFRDKHPGYVGHFFSASSARVMGANRELFALAKDGREIPVEISLSPIDYGTEIRVAAALHDITDRKAAEIALREAKAAAEAATAAKGNFLASMSHEIRTPMNGITAMAELLSQSELNDDQRHMLKTIRNSGNSLITIINDILDFSKIEAGKLDIEDIAMSIVDAVEGVASTLTPNARSKGVRIHTFVDPNLPASVQGDPVRLRQLLFNMGGNAVKFSDKKDVTMRAVPLAGPDAEHPWVRFEVIDQGIGISEANQAKLFRAFSQAEASTTRRFGGTGLGLAICKRLVELMGGRIGVTSREGAGSTFWVELPLVATDKTRSNEKPRDLHGLRVLVLGAAEPRRTTMTTYLDHWGAEALVATDTEAAIALIKKDAAPFSSIVIDLDLDGERQAEAAAALRKTLGKRAIPMIVLEDYQHRGPRIPGPDLVTVDASPLIRYRFITAVAVAAGRASPQVHNDDEVMQMKPRKAPTAAEARAAGELILLAEDNLTNQDVIRRQLNMLGYACEIANDGKEAFAAWRKGGYALLLTDCHMPEMDGYELTGAIRKDERDTGKRMPIIAVTANALQGEAERCIAAGMDDYISKPIAMPALKNALGKWMPARANGEAAKESAPPPSIDAPATDSAAMDVLAINDRAIKDMFGDDAATFKEILGEFLPVSEDIVKDILAGAAAASSGEVAKAAHKLKSAARSVGADALADVCVALESAGKTGDLSAIAKLAPGVPPLMKAVATYIKAL